MNLYVGNLSYNLQEHELTEAFEAFGQVSSVRIMTDRDTGRPRGFGFVEMADKAAGEAAIAGLDGSELAGRRMVVNEARPRPARRF